MKMTPIGVTHKARADVPASCADEITPECLQALYNIPSTPATFGNITVTGFFGEIANQTDLEVGLIVHHTGLDLLTVASAVRC